MSARRTLLIAAMLGFTLAARAIDPLPEAEQAKRALAIIDAYHAPRGSSPPKKLHVVYFTPADKEPAARYQERVDAILKDIQGFYRENLERLGFGARTFPLATNAEGSVKVLLVRSKHPEEAFPRWQDRNGGNTGDPEGGRMVRAECEPLLKSEGISLEQETVLILCHLAAFDPVARSFRHRSPYFGSWNQQSGLCFAADWAEQDLANLTEKNLMLTDAEYGRMSLGKHMTIFLGGIAHELGHAFALPHCGERREEKALGTSLLGGGNHTYREERRGEGKGSFLTMATALRLASRPLFNGSAKGERLSPELAESELTLSTNLSRKELASRPGALHIEGSVRGTPPVYAVIAYFDLARDGGYTAPTATSVPDKEGRFALEISDLRADRSGEIRVEYCHVNGAVSERTLPFATKSDGSIDLSDWQLRRVLEPIASAVGKNDVAESRKAFAELNSSDVAAEAKRLAQKLVASLSPDERVSPKNCPADVRELGLGDAAAESAEVGWLKPGFNRIPSNGEIPSPLLDSGSVYLTGLYAHSPSRYRFALGGGWKRLRGEAGLHTAHQPNGTVRFVIRADGKEVFRSQNIRGALKASYDVDVTGVDTLELITEKATSSNAGNWALWLAPTLER